MGKLLVIKDADFAINGMNLGTSIDIAPDITLTRGYNVNGETSYVPNKRLGTASPVDLSNYIAQGYRTLVAKIILDPTVHNQCLQIQNADGSVTERPSQAYTGNDLIVALNPNMPYLRYSTAKDADYYAATYLASTFAEIKLIKF